MSFVNSQYFIYVILTIILILFVMMRQNRKYFRWIKTYWFLERTWINFFSTSFYYLSLALMLLSLMDLRGPEKKIRGNLPDQRTIIVLDASLSMLCEDVRPNRFIKAIQLARHFVKNSAGHQISIVLFSDTQKRLLPFTDDIDLVDSRLAALENTNAVGGGSNISQAISEAAGYFESDGESATKETTGNMLVFTDAEESEGGLDLTLPSNVNLALIGVGTAKGGSIPLRWDDGTFKGYKTHKNETVITKLDEKYIKSIGKKVKNYNYWMVNSYSLPTEEILNFFRATYNKAHNNGDMRVRPVYSHLILIPAIIFYCLSVLLGRFSTFKAASVAIFILVTTFVGAPKSFAEDSAHEKPQSYSKDLSNDLNKLKEGNATHKETLKVAEKLLREKDEKNASRVYSEYLKNTDDEEAKFNYVTSLLKQGKFKEAKPLASQLLKNTKNEDLKNKMRQNMLLAIEEKKKSQEQQQDKKQDKKQEDQKEKKDNQNDQQNNKKDEKQKNKQDQKNQENKQNQQKGQSKKDRKENGQKQSQPNKGEDGKEKDKENDKKKSEEDKKKNEQDKKQDDKEEGKEEERKGPKSLEEKEKEIEQKRRMTKIPGMVKQIMNDDRELQKKLMDTSTKEKGDLKPTQDW